MKILSLFCLVSSLAITANAQAEVYKWVDENGEVHYSETLPPDFQDKKFDGLSDEGVTQEKDQTLTPPPPPPSLPPDAAKAGPKELPRDKSGMKRPTPLYTDEQVKQQQDGLLLLRYDSERELLDAMEVEVKQLGYDAVLLNGSRSSLMEAYRGNVREAADTQRAGLAVEPELLAKINDLKQKLVSNSATLATLKAREEEIRQKFESELATYRKLSAETAAHPP